MYTCVAMETLIFELVLTVCQICLSCSQDCSEVLLCVHWSLCFARQGYPVQLFFRLTVLFLNRLVHFKV